MDRRVQLEDCKQALEKLDFTPCFMEHENFEKDPQGFLPIDGSRKPLKVLGYQCPSVIQEGRPHCNHKSAAREIIIGVIETLRALGVLASGQSAIMKARVKNIGKLHEQYDVEVRVLLYAKVDDRGDSPEIRNIRGMHDRNRQALQAMRNKLLLKIGAILDAQPS